MAAPPPQPPSRGGMSLYANLLDDGSASIARDPVLFKNEQDHAPTKKAIDPALRFQPIRRPQINKPSAKPKPAFPKAPPTATAPHTSSTTAVSTPPTAPTSTAAPNRSTLADWAAAEDDDAFYHGGGPSNDKRQRGGRRKKKNRKEDAPHETDWDELYDPARPTNVEEYLRSEERVREVRDWKAVLYAHRRRRGDGDGDGSDGEGSEEGGEGGQRGALGNQFAPPAAFSFAPPPMSPPRVLNDATGDDAYARRLALSGMAPPPPPSTETASPAPPPPPPPTNTDPATISRAPIRYSQPPNLTPTTAMDIDNQDDTDYDPEVDYTSIPLPPPSTTNQPPQQPHHPQQPPSKEEPEERTTRPGQKDFAQRLMAKYGWTKGSGLGAAESGITSALRVQVEKRKRKPDAEGGGFAGPAGGRGRIIAPKSHVKGKSGGGGAGGGGEVGGEGGGGEGGGEAGGGVGKMSVVVVLDRMLDGMADVEGEVEAGLGQEIGEECGERYGRVERIVVDVEGARVFIRFVEGVSALRAVNALQGRIFNGNAITARFYDEEQFEEGVYDG